MNKIFFANLERGRLLFKRFRTLRCINARNDSAIYLCADCYRKGLPVALKIISVQGLKDTIIAERFRNEMEVTYRIKHPNVLKCDTFFEDETFLAFAMDYIRGGTVADLLARSEKLSILQSMEILRQLCHGLQAVHDAGILHRDIKPENILLRRKDGRILIADFGIAVLGQTAISKEHEGLYGTINYLCPEYIERGWFDKRSDIYSLGLMAYEMITGQLPYTSGSPLEKMTERVKSDPASPISIDPKCPAQLSAIIMKALSRDPEARFQSANELRLALKGLGASKKRVLKVKHDQKHTLNDDARALEPTVAGLVC
ncbi:serine/threonine protein kinase [Oligoflexia bacterium]|nr:serine/threonine protein kinase [Oligoflexia bacterium]